VNETDLEALLLECARERGAAAPHLAARVAARPRPFGSRAAFSDIQDRADEIEAVCLVDYAKSATFLPNWLTVL